MSASFLDQSQVDVWNHAGEFAQKVILPAAAKADRDEVFPQEIYKKAIEAGLCNLTIPEQYGGAGLSALQFVTVAERLAWGCVGITGAISLNSLSADVLLLAGNDDQRKKYLKRIIDGEVAGYAVTEPAAGSDVAGIQCRAIKKGTDYVLSGSKTWISNATEASFFVVFAKTDSQAGHKGMSAFLVDKKTPGFRIGKKLGKMGQRAFPAAELFLEDVVVSSSNLVGKEGDGFTIAMKVFDRSRPMVAALGVGLMQRCLDEAIQYAKSRNAMGAPLLKHQAISQKIAEIGVRLEAARLLTYKSAQLLDQGKRNTLQASYAKVFAADNAVYCASEALQVFGGMGYSTEYPMEKLYRDAKVLQIYEGTSEIQKLIIARELSAQT